ncbi:MAG: exonuclease SbcCD subunit D C-terminal domain-containing protein [Bacteroidetes bacterium]|nr:exonuclease SbcCD subunit D C-terminal domain-containing protein [Bacteroidota bacterium]
MKILHTSDWHLGRSLYDKKRYDEFEAFLDWLTDFITLNNIELLLVAGDIFDTTTPGNRAQELYYRFLGKVTQTGCRHVVITGGNHDSPTFLEAPKSILGFLNIHVMGSKTENPEDEIFELKNKQGLTEAIVCAVPFLHDRDVRIAEADETPGDKAKKLLQGIAAHYRKIADDAQRLQDQQNPVPIIGMGHLFTRNAKTTEGDGVRELYIGTMAHVDGESVSQGFDYMALGHLHLAQKVDYSKTVRYSGSPIQLSFSEAGQTKKVIVAEFGNKIPVITEHPVPIFQELIRITGDLAQVSGEIEKLKEAGTNAWLEVEITALTDITHINARFDELLAGSKLEILRIKNKTVVDRALTQVAETETLETLDDADVFARCLDAFEIPVEERGALTETYNEAKASWLADDPNAD